MSDFLASLAAIVGPNALVTDSGDMLPHFHDYRGRYVGTGLGVVKPADTQQVAQVVRLCAQHNIKIVPQGGNTGLVGGSIPYDMQSIVISTARMNKIRTIDAQNFTATVEAGVVLATLQQAARDAGRYFPLSYGAEGSAQIGGAISSNAGGILTLRYGNTRDLVLGLEVVLSSGEIWDGLRGLRKDNSGYDLKQLFIGAEGTLGIVTAAVMKLYPDPGARTTFLCALRDVDASVEIFSRARDAFGQNIEAFELMPQAAFDLAAQVGPVCNMPLQTKTEWLLLGEIAAASIPASQIEEFLAAQFERGLIVDATVAHNEAQRKELWFLREAVTETQRNAGASIKHDIAVPVSSIPAFLREALPLVRKLLPGARPIVFGHLGDGNLHFNISKPQGADDAAFLARWDEVNHKVHDVVQKFAGSIAAEHGVGTFKRDEIAVRKSAVEMQLLRTVKDALDPQGLFNPNVLLARR